MRVKSSKMVPLKAGHPPAVNAGGKRVVKRNLGDNASHGTADKVTKSPDKSRKSRPDKGEGEGHDFPETPVSVRHSRVRPAMDKPHSPRAFYFH